MSETPCDNTSPSESGNGGNKKNRESSKGTKAQKIDAVVSEASNGDDAIELISTSEEDDVQSIHNTEQSMKDTQKPEPCTTKELSGDGSPKMTDSGSDDLLKHQESKKGHCVVKDTIKNTSLKFKNTEESSETEILKNKGSSSIEPMGPSTDEFMSDEKYKNTQDAKAGKSECGSQQSISHDLSKQKKKGANSSSNVKQSETKLLKRLEINKYANFMKDFDPEHSQRVAHKLENLHFPEKKEKKKPKNDKRLYDENGIFIETGEDLCDCLIKDCPGCHFPCSKCRSCKCGHACRRNRTWYYDEIEIEGTGEIIRRKK